MSHNKKKFVIKDETRKRCQIVNFNELTSKRFSTVSLELFHFLYQVKNINFSIYFLVDDSLIEFIKPHEFKKELLDQIWNALHKEYEGIEIKLLKSDVANFQSLIDDIRTKKINALVAKTPELDRKTVDIFSNLSSASQLIVRGGLSHEVVERVKASASFLVSNLLDCELSVGTLSKMITCDPTLYDHSAAVSMIATALGGGFMKSALSQKEVTLLTQCALYHDVGKTCVPPAVLNKPGKYTPAEFEVMKTHTNLGYEELTKSIEKGMPIDPLVALTAKEHHEKFDGSGYPDGKKGRLEDNAEQGIHLFSRIISVADVYSALLMKRAYKPSYEPLESLKIMMEMAEVHFDPIIFKSFMHGIVKSLNKIASKSSSPGRILSFNPDGTLVEYKNIKKAGFS